MNLHWGRVKCILGDARGHEFESGFRVDGFKPLNLDAVHAADDLVAGLEVAQEAAEDLGAGGRFAGDERDVHALVFRANPISFEANVGRVDGRAVEVGLS